ncbi:hypothetical protein EBZ39_03570 [bacterium]|nr:hypothetical protein [bacterium]
MRGQELFNKIGEVASPADGEARNDGSGTGRSAALIAARNERLCHRLYYYRHHTQLRYDVVLQKLSNEFDLTQSTLVQVLEKLTDEIVRVRAAKPTVAELQGRWGWMVW